MPLGDTVAIATEWISEPIEGVHRALSGRVLDAMGTGDTPVRRGHDAGLGMMYRSVRFLGTTVGVGLDMGVSLEQRNADRIQALSNALWGDVLAIRGSRLAIEMGIRDRHGDPAQIPDRLVETHPNADGNLVVLVHGLGETEQCWIGDDEAPGLLEVLESHYVGSTALVRYNTGLHISDNGARLNQLIDELVSSWPVSVETITLVGHSMGGLVIRSACLAASESGSSWIDKVGDVVTVGTPHKGAPVEKIINIAAWGMGLVPETRPVADYLNSRSAGIKDLRYGAVASDDWRDLDIDSLLGGSVGNHPLPPDIDHHFVAGVVAEDPSHPLGLMFGDLLVRETSGTGAGRLEPLNAVVVGGTNHLNLLRDPIVTDRIIEWIAPGGEPTEQ